MAAVTGAGVDVVRGGVEGGLADGFARGDASVLVVEAAD